MNRKGANFRLVIESNRPTAGPLATLNPRTALRRMTVVSDYDDFCDVMRDALGESHEVMRFGSAMSLTELADTRPEVLALGPMAPPLAPSSLTVWELVALARSHRDLRSVPIVVLTADLDAVMGEPGLLARHPAVYAITIPVDLDTLTSVLKSVERDGREQPTNRVPDVCRHGYEVEIDGQAACAVCS